MPLRLKTAIATYGHSAALKDGRVSIEGVAPDFIEINPIIQAFRRMVRDVEFDICEMAPATYMIARSFGAPFKALPIFIFRRFHHGGIVYREDSGIRQPRDLEGKRVGVRAYSVSTGIWTRGILANEYGVDTSKVTWVVDDEEHVTQLKLPANVVHAPAGQSLVSMMASGALQAAFTGPAGIGRAGAPKDGWEASKVDSAATYRELFDDVEKREVEWFRSTGIQPFQVKRLRFRERIEQRTRHPRMVGQYLVLDHDQAMCRIDSGAAKPFGFALLDVIEQLTICGG